MLEKDSLKSEGVDGLELKSVYIIIHSGWSLALIFMKERVKSPSLLSAVVF